MASLRNIRFLVIDDNPHTLQILRAVLNGLEGQHIQAAHNAAQAIGLLHETKVDIVILDIQLETESGLDVLAKIRADPDQSIAFLPVIMLSGHSDLSGVQLARDAGANEFCSKPVVPAALLRKIVAVIERPRPFVRAGGYFGPERRRKVDPDYDGPERRAEKAVLEA